MKKVLVLAIATLSLGTTTFAQTHKKTKKVQAKATIDTKVSAPAVAVAATTATAAAADNKAPIEFKESTYSFGKIKQGTPVTHVFSFKNTSSAPVVIENATAQCGCTTPEYPKTPVAKGATEQIKVTYNAAAVGSFTKQVTVRLAKQAEPIILTINGEVVAPDAEKKG